VSSVPADLHVNCHVNYTYNFNLCRINSLNHFIISGALFDTSILSVVVFHVGDNLSDHDAVLAVFNTSIDSISCYSRIFSSRIAWHKAEKANYESLKLNLSRITIPSDALSCRDSIVSSLGPQHGSQYTCW